VPGPDQGEEPGRAGGPAARRKRTGDDVRLVDGFAEFFDRRFSCDDLRGMTTIHSAILVADIYTILKMVMIGTVSGEAAEFAQ
jgi:hypothetical protein